MSAKIVGFINQKGGVGKSFVSKIAANALSGGQYKKRVLVIDCDEQGTVVTMRKRDAAIMQSNGNVPAFAYEVVSCPSEHLPSVVGGKKKVVDIGGVEKTLNIDDAYDYVIVDMPGRGQNDDINALLASLDYAVIVTTGDDSETFSTLDFLNVIAKTQILRKKCELEPLKIALMYNQFENTAIYEGTVKFWETQKHKYDIYREILYLSKKETYRRFNDTYSNLLYELKCNKGLNKLLKEMENFISKLIDFFEK